MLEDKDQLGIILIDRGGATFATIRGSNLNIIESNRSFVPSKHGMGGQSAGRIERGIEILAQEFYSKMARKANQLYLEKHPVTALVIGGPAMSKDQFIEHPTLDYRLKNMIYKVYDVGYTTPEGGVRELLFRASDDLDDYAMVSERKLVQKFLEELGADSGKAIYGEEPIRKAFAQSAIDVLLFSEAIEKINAKIQCTNCKKSFLESTTPENMPELKTKVGQTDCPKCGKYSLTVVEDQYLVEEFEKLAEETGATIEVISMGHEDGVVLKNTFGGIAAILRFSFDW
ncbi:MAG: peptide chain release factor aRF-1 [Candidatus Kariarchaeaceae archaeon]|jgi:peptide chain release factor subunit 1